MVSTTFSCSACGFVAHRWFGRCPECGGWSTAAQPAGAAEDSLEVRSLADAGSAPGRIASGLEDLDRVLGGGLVRGSVALLAGEPGVGKSTLLLQLIDGLVDGGRTCLLVTGEESLDQVALRAARLGIPLDRVKAIATTSFEAALATAAKERPDVVVVDSIQTMEQRDLGQPAGSIVQVRECAAGLVRFAKDSGTTTVLTGHVTKEGAVAGPKVLEHVVDITLALLGERDGTIRILRAGKNRFGSCEEAGVFSMTERGLEGVTDPSTMLMADRCVDVAGSAVFPGLEGSRPLLVELQALVPDAAQQLPRYHAIGLDARRLSLLIGVLKEHAKTDFKNRDVFAAAAGGIAIKEPGADLALCLALRSSITTTPLDSRLVAVGEVGLSGELRRVSGLDRRLKEAARLGFTRAIVPHGNARISSDLEVCTARSVGEAFALAGREKVAV